MRFNRYFNRMRFLVNMFTAVIKMSHWGFITGPSSFSTGKYLPTHVYLQKVNIYLIIVIVLFTLEKLVRFISSMRERKEQLMIIISLNSMCRYFIQQLHHFVLWTSVTSIFYLKKLSISTYTYLCTCRYY